MTNGLAHEGAISAAAETDTWTISANSRDRITVQVAKVSGGAGFTPRLELLAPDGAVQGADAGSVAARVDLQAHVTGTFTARVSDASRSGAGTYRLRLAQVPGALPIPTGNEGGPLTNGVNHSGVINLGDLDLWTINARQGDRITVQVAKLSGGAAFSPMLELFAPDGARLGVQWGAVAARMDMQAGTDGLYTVLVSDAAKSGTGSYSLQLAQVPAVIVVPTGDEGGILNLIQDHNGTITLGDFDLWTFNASPGDRMVVQITELSGGAGFTPMVELFAPDGRLKRAAQGATAATLDAAIEVDGTYTLLVSDATQTGTGTYRLNLTRDTIAPPGANMLTNGATHLGSISSAGETNNWTFAATAGESIVVRVGETTTAGLVPWVRLFGPNGVLLANDFNSAAAEVTVRATNTGTFLVVVADGSTQRNQTGNYRISLAKTGSLLSISPSEEGGPLTNGTTYLAAIDTGDVDAWTFTANLGETVIVRVGETTTADLSPWVRLFGPNGALLAADFNAAAAEVTVRATNSGTFLVVVADGTSALGQSGNYQISLAKTGSPLDIAPSDEGGPLTNGATYLAAIETGDVDAWTFTANVGENIVVWAGEVTSGSGLVPWLRLFGPNGALLAADFNAAAAEVTVRATNSGTFLVVIGDGTSALGQAGAYRISLAKTGSPLDISPSDEGGALVNGSTYLAAIETGDVDGWTISANEGESIVVWAGELTAGSGLVPWLRLFGPNGALLAADFNAAAAEVTVRATNSGTFLAVVGDGTSGRSGTGSYRLSLVKSGEPLVISPGDEGGPLTNGAAYLAAIETGDVDGWTFTANTGQSIVVRAGETTTGSLVPWLRLFGPNGVLLDTAFSAVAAEVTARATNSGTFLVVVGDGNSGRGGTGNYRLSVVKSGEPVVISAGDDGGALAGDEIPEGMVEVGDLDVWTFTACADTPILVRVDESVPGSGLTPWLRLYGRDGALLNNVVNVSFAQISLLAPASGRYTIVVGDGGSGFASSGNYQLTVNGLSDGLKFCLPIASGVNVNLHGVGGVADAVFVLTTSTNINTPQVLWTPIATNQFDQFGAFSYTNLLNQAEQRRFFILQQ